MEPKKVTRKKLKKSIKSSRTKKLPQNLKDISVKKSMKEHNILNTNYYNLLFSLFLLNKKYDKFDLIINNKLNMELLVENNKFTLSFSKKKFTKILKYLIDNYSSEKKRFIILPICILFNITYLFYSKTINYLHQNIIIIDLKEKKAEYFEPHGGLYSKNFNKIESIKKKDNFYKELYKNSRKIYLELKPIFKKLKIKFILPHQYLDIDDFQNVESSIEIYNKTSSQRKEDLEGYCLVWCLWFVSLRLKYPNTDLKELVQSAKSILKNDYTYRNFIRNYAKDIYIKNNKLLKENKLNIWKRGLIGEHRFKKKLKKLIEKNFTIYK